jgi:hypothetical protein
MTSTAPLSSPKTGEGFGFPLGFCGAVAAALVAVSAGATEHHAYSLIALAIVVAVVAAKATLRAAFGTAVVAWGLQAGFVIGRTGHVVFNAESARDAAVFLAAGLLAGALVAAWRAARAALQTETSEPVVNEPPAVIVNTVPTPQSRARTHSSLSAH